MLTFLAQIPNATPTGMGSWLVDAAAILAIVMLVLNIVSHFKAKPPLDEKLSALDEKYAAKSDHKELKNRVDKIEDNHREDLGRLFGNLEAISASVSRIEGRLIEQDKNK